MAQAERPIGPLAPVGFIMMAGMAMVCAVPAYAGAFARKAWDRHVSTRH